MTMSRRRLLALIAARRDGDHPDPSPGLVLAASQIAGALSDHDGRVVAVVSHYAMSGGTLIALAARDPARPPCRSRTGRSSAGAVRGALARRSGLDARPPRRADPSPRRCGRKASRSSGEGKPSDAPPQPNRSADPQALPRTFAQQPRPAHECRSSAHEDTGPGVKLPTR